MRVRYVIGIIVIAVLAVGAKLLLSPPKSEALSSDAGLDVQQMHKDKNVQKIPDQNWSDMSLVFDRNN
jgi:preprotein translocase subunit SecG